MLWTRSNSVWWCPKVGWTMNGATTSRACIWRSKICTTPKESTISPSSSTPWIWTPGKVWANCASPKEIINNSRNTKLSFRSCKSCSSSKTSNSCKIRSYIIYNEYIYLYQTFTYISYGKVTPEFYNFYIYINIYFISLYFYYRISNSKYRINIKFYIYSIFWLRNFLIKI